MKRKFIAFFGALLFAGLMSASWSADAQTYSGYLMLDDSRFRGPDSVLVSITVPEGTYVRDTVYFTPGEARALKKIGKGRNYYSTPWMMSVKTNLLSDAIAVPYGGLEFQIAPKMSFELSGWYTPFNIFHPNEQTNVYGFSPEVRWWFGERAMRKGAFAGLHGNVSWYTLEWVDAEGKRVIYQNGTDDVRDTGTKYPSWSAGATLGYLLPLDRRGHWNLELFMGVGYASYRQKCIYPATEEEEAYFEHEENSYIGITKVGINLTYNFSLRRVKPGYYR